jgi:AraC-like DNA-binding protein
MEKTLEAQKRWMEEIPSGQFRKLFENLPGTLFFAKNRDLKLMMANAAFVARCGKSTEAEIVGIDDYDLFPDKFASKFRSDDLKVLETGKPIGGIVEMFPNAVGHPDWSVTDKMPLFDKDGKVCGICGTVRSYEGVRESLGGYLEVQPAAEYLKRNFRKKLDIQLLASLVGMSERQLERKFSETFRASPRAYLCRIRILIASELLKRTSKTVTEIALEVGFYDHSDLSRHFKREVGDSPSVFRMKQIKSGSTDKKADL